MESNAQDFKYNFVINAIRIHFDVYKGQARQEFQNFCKQQLTDQIEYNQRLQQAMTLIMGHLKSQENLVAQKIQVQNILIDQVAMLNKTKARSLYTLLKNLDYKIYQFLPNDHLELVNGTERSEWSRNYLEYIEEEKKRKLSEEERKKSQAKLEERMKQPLQGNLALNFLFKDQDIGEIIKMKQPAEGS